MITLIGGRSQLGQCFIPISTLPLSVLTSENLDLRKSSQISSVLKNDKNKYLINFAAFNDVESSEHDKDAFLINHIAVKELAKHCTENNKVFIHISSDYVFDGLQGEYVESDRINPINKYGESRALGEQAVQEYANNFIILRTSWLYSHLPTKYNFFNKVSPLLLKGGQVLEGAYDSLGSPTSALSFAHAINHMLEYLIEKNHVFNRIFHYSDVGQISRFNFLEEIANQLNIKFNLSNIIKPVSNTSFNLKAPRPKDTSLNSELFEKTFDYKRLEWDTALQNILRKV